MEWIEIDGSQGEGGGQILRTCLSLAACLKKALRIVKIRHGRNKPGLMRQHLACVEAMKLLINAQVKGAMIGSSEIEFIPDKIVAGKYQFSVGSAGSTTLLFQTLLPVLMRTGVNTCLQLTGGTHNPMAPGFDFIRTVFLPVLAQIGLAYQINISRYGFYPVGAGVWQIELLPAATYRSINLIQRGQLLRKQGRCISANIPGHVIEREQRQLLKLLKWPSDSILIEQVDSLGAGNVVALSLGYEYGNEWVESIGRVGVSAEQIAKQAVHKLKCSQKLEVPVGHYLADQLLLPLLLGGGGRFLTGSLTDHFKTNVSVIQQFTGDTIQIEARHSKSQTMVHVKAIDCQ